MNETIDSRYAIPLTADEIDTTIAALTCLWYSLQNELAVKQEKDPATDTWQYEGRMRFIDAIQSKLDDTRRNLIDIKRRNNYAHGSNRKAA